MSETINPKPSFVIKSKILTAYESFPAGTKIFINVLTDPKIPRPDDAFSPVQTFALIMESKWEIPIYVTSSLLKTTTDKKGVKSLYVNCIINDQCLKWCLLNGDLLTILKEWCVESVEFQFTEQRLEIDRDSITTPKLSYKGDEADIQDLEIQLSDLKSVNKLFEEREEQYNTDKPEGVLEFKKLAIEAEEEEDSQLGAVSVDELLGKTRGGKRPLIEVIESSDVPEAVQKPQNRKVKDSDKPRLPIEVSMTKLDPEETQQNYAALLKFKSDTDDYDLSFDQDKVEIHVTTNSPTYSREKSMVKFGLPFVPTRFESFYNMRDQTLYLYI